MGRNKKTPFNHKAENTSEACGLSFETFVTKHDAWVDKMNDEQPELSSVICESLENTFSKRELAFMVTEKLQKSSRLSPKDFLGALTLDILEAALASKAEAKA